MDKEIQDAEIVKESELNCINCTVALPTVEEVTCGKKKRIYFRVTCSCGDKGPTKATEEEAKQAWFRRTRNRAKKKKRNSIGN